MEEYCDVLSPMDMRPELANILFKEGASLIIAGVPTGTKFGIDISFYTIGERFRGVKMIPCGPHVVFCASQGSYGDSNSGPRVGFVHYFKPGEIVIREWDSNSEELRKRKVENLDAEMGCIRENLQHLEKFLAPYDYRGYKKWRNLSDKITENTILRCQPATGMIRSNLELQSCPDSERPRGDFFGNYKLKNRQVIDESELLPRLEPMPGSAPNFTSVPERIPKGLKPAEVSENYMDCFCAAQELFKSFPKDDDFLQEIQLAFIFFQPGCCLEALSHWRKILNILSNSESVIKFQKLFYIKYLDLLQHQLPELPEELMQPSDRNTVHKDVRNLLKNCTMQGLIRSAQRLSTSLSFSMKWTFENLLEEDPDDMPVIVPDLNAMVVELE